MINIKQKLSATNLKKHIRKNWLYHLFLIAIFLDYLLIPTDTDLGWHLRYGKEILEKGTVYRNNQLGFYLSNYEWAHSYSLYQLLVFLIYNFFGLWGLSITGAILSVTIFWFCCPKNKKGTYLKAIFLYLGFMSVAKMGIRSQFFTVLAVVFLLRKLEKKKYSLKNLYQLPIIFLFWVNLHGGFVLGILVLAIYFLESLIKKNKQNQHFLALATVLSFLATLANPFGVKVYQESLRHSWYPLDKLIAEWVPPTNKGIFIILVASSLILVSLVYQIFINKKNKHNHLVANLIVWIIFTYLALSARRHLPLFTVSSIFVMESIWSKTMRLKKDKQKILKQMTAAILAGIIVFKFFNLPKITKNRQLPCQGREYHFPCQAENFLKSNPNICKNIYNTYEWGGHIAWQLPERRTFIDGRMPAWPTEEGKSPYTIWLEIIQAQSGFEKRLDNFSADCIFISKGTFLDLELRKENENHPWQIIYDDDFAVIWQKNE